MNQPRRNPHPVPAVAVALLFLGVALYLGQFAGDLAPGPCAAPPTGAVPTPAAGRSEKHSRPAHPTTSTARVHSSAEAPDGPVEETAIRLANQDLARALNWWETLDEGRLSAGLAIAYEASRTQPLEALRVLVALPPCRDRDDALIHAFRQWMCLEPAVAAEWGLNVNDSALESRLVSALAFELAEFDGATAAGLVSARITGPEEQSRAAVGVLQRWAQTEPDAALAWLARFPEGPVACAARTALDCQKLPSE